MAPKTVLFHRVFGAFQGGHLKVSDYIHHFNAIEGYTSILYVSPKSNPFHPWTNYTGLVNEYDPVKADVLFLAGDDWAALHDFPGIEQTKPVINLIQGFRHLDRESCLYKYLSRKAIRISVSEELTSALASSRACNGPIYTISNCIDTSLLPTPTESQPLKVFIVGIKQPHLASELNQRLRDRGVHVESIVEQIPRQLFLRKLNEASIVVALPYAVEGFYLPALEAMALGKALICPDCVGNRGFCTNRINCLMPDFDLNQLEIAVLTLLADPQFALGLQEQAWRTSQRHTLEHERKMFADIIAANPMQ
jgi:hypothetical protein